MTVRDEALGVRPQADLLSQSIAEIIDRSPRSRKAIAAASGGALLSAALFVAPAPSAFAQEEDAAATETVLVTGSRIPRRDFTANAPIMTVDEQLFDDTSLIGVETVLNQMPQFVPAVTQFTTNDVAQTATNTVGVSTVSLRGLGPNRNLVLVNGQRAMPVDPTMIVDTNSIPSSAIARVEVISGGASAVYGADAVGGVVNFVLKDNFEGASVDLRVADTQHGGSQEITLSGLIGANTADGRGNVMIGVERATRTKQRQWERDWRLADFANPNVNGDLFVWGGSTWINSEFSNFGPVQVEDPDNPGTFIPNNVDQAALDAVFDQLAPGTITPGGLQLRVNDDGTVYTGQGFFQTSDAIASGAYRYNGPIWGDPSTPNGGSGDLNGDFLGLPVFVEQPNGYIKENNLYSWSSSPLERLSSFGSGHFDVTDRVRVTAQASLSRTKTESSLGQTAANLNQWGAGVPFGDEIYRGNNSGDFIGEAIDTSIYDIPDSLIDVNDNGIADAGDMTNPAFTIDGRFGVECDAPATPEMPWLDGLPGCTMSEAWPTSADIYNIYSSRPDPNAIIWINRPPDYLRSALGAGRSTTNTTTTMNFSLGLEGELPSGDDFWDITVSTGRSDNNVQQRGSVALTHYRYLMLFPNFGRDAIFDPNPTDDGFAESNPTCTTGLPIIERFRPSLDCVRMISPSLKTEREMTQSILEANIFGDLAEMPAGPLQYALGATYRENSFNYEPDFTSDNNSIFQIAGSYPNEPSNGEFDVSEIYGELLIPIVSGGPTGVEHFTVELGARVSDWSMPQMPNLETYKALIDWGITDKYRIRGGFNRAFRAPNLGELFISRTQGFTGFGSSDWCSQNLDAPSLQGAHFSATPLAGAGQPDDAQSAQSYNICRALMGPTGAFEYYDNRPLSDQTNDGGTGVSNSFGNPNLREERADTFTIGVVMDFVENMTLTVDWYEIEIQDMIALIGADATYQTCLDIAFNPTGDPNAPACQNVARNTATGSGSFVDRIFSNLGRAKMSGADIQLNWNRPLGPGNFTFNTVANYNLVSETQDRSDLPTLDHVGYSSCSLQIQCQQYVYRIFSTVNYFQGPWNVSLRHQYWPELEPASCATAPAAIACVNNIDPTYQLFALTGGYTFADRYRVNMGIENLLDEDPPCTGANPNATPWPTVCNHSGGGSTYDPLGRRFFVSMTMDF
jgi:outer membrane receptor protein involved in Fe transport